MWLQSKIGLAHGPPRGSGTATDRGVQCNRSHVGNGIRERQYRGQLPVKTVTRRYLGPFAGRVSMRKERRRVGGKLAAYIFGIRVCCSSQSFKALILIRLPWRPLRLASSSAYCLRLPSLVTEQSPSILVYAGAIRWRPATRWETERTRDYTWRRWEALRERQRKGASHI